MFDALLDGIAETTAETAVNVSGASDTDFSF